MAKVVATPSCSESGIVSKECPRRIINTVYHGVVVPANTCSETALRVVYVGTIGDSRKDVKTLLDAVSSVLKAHPKTEFCLVGNDSGHLVETQFRNSNPEIPKDSVRFVGRVSKEEVMTFLESCAVYASAATAESFGLAVVEAMACGKPVVACAASAMLETVEDGITGILVPPHDPSAFAEAIIRLLVNDELRLKMGQAARKRVLDKFTDAKMAENYERFLQTTLGIGRSA